MVKRDTHRIFNPERRHVKVRICRTKGMKKEKKRTFPGMPRAVWKIAAELPQITPLQVQEY